MEASKIQAQQLKDCFDDIEFDSGISGILDEVSSYCKRKASEYNHPIAYSLFQDYKEKGDMITALANKIRIRELF